MHIIHKFTYLFLFLFINLGKDDLSKNNYRKAWRKKVEWICVDDFFNVGKAFSSSSKHLFLWIAL